MTISLVRVMDTWFMDVAGQLCGDTSADMWPSHESSHSVGNIQCGPILANNVGITATRADMSPTFPTKGACIGTLVKMMFAVDSMIIQSFKMLQQVIFVFSVQFPKVLVRQSWSRYSVKNGSGRWLLLKSLLCTGVMEFLLSMEKNQSKHFSGVYADHQNPWLR